MTGPVRCPFHGRTAALRWHALPELRPALLRVTQLNCSAEHSLQAGSHTKLFLPRFFSPALPRAMGSSQGLLASLSLSSSLPAHPDFTLPSTSLLAKGLWTDFLSKLLFPLISSWHPPLGFCLPHPLATALCPVSSHKKPWPGEAAALAVSLHSGFPGSAWWGLHGPGHLSLTFLGLTSFICRNIGSRADVEGELFCCYF